MDQNLSNKSDEANLDIQWSMALSHPVKNHFYSVGGRGPFIPDVDQPNKNSNEPYQYFFQWLFNQSVLPHTISISYGENEQSVPRSYAENVCNMIGKLGAMGTSVIVSSGDTGPGSACQSNDAKKVTKFLPTFPGACPYVTSVGSTEGLKPEKAVSFSSGGFSDIWARPWYQENQVSRYVANENKWKSKNLYNPKARGFPDISAQGRNFYIYDKDKARKIAGTSASAPVIAGIVGLLNAQQIQAGNPTLGFLNPWIYEFGPQMLTDITSGKSKGCTGVSIYSGWNAAKIENAGWDAVPGWDPVTGMGTPLFDKMLKYLPKRNTAAAASSATKPPTPSGTTTAMPAEDMDDIPSEDGSDSPTPIGSTTTRVTAAPNASSMSRPSSSSVSTSSVVPKASAPSNPTLSPSPVTAITNRSSPSVARPTSSPITINSNPTPARGSTGMSSSPTIPGIALGPNISLGPKAGAPGLMTIPVTLTVPVTVTVPVVVTSFITLTL
jgi:subtilase family protein